MRRVALLFGPVILAVVLGTAGCSSSSSSKTNPGSGGGSTTVAPATTVAPTATTLAPAATTQPSAPPCTIPQNNGGDHDSDNNGAPSDGDGCNQ